MPEHESDLLARITADPGIFGGKPIIRGHRLAVEHVPRYAPRNVSDFRKAGVRSVDPFKA